MQNSPSFNTPLPLNSFVSHQHFKPVPFSDKLKPLRKGPFKIKIDPAEVTYELLTQDGKTFHAQRY